MANIRVSEDVYNRLKKEAGQQFRTIGGHIEYLIAVHEDVMEKAYEEKAQEWERQQANLPDEMQSPVYRKMRKL